MSLSYIHPTDKNWPSNGEREKTSRPAPLVPQSDLFLRSQSTDFYSGRNDRSASRDSRFSGIKHRKRVDSLDNGRRGSERKGKDREIDRVDDNVKVVAQDTKPVPENPMEMSPRNSEQSAARVVGQGEDDIVPRNQNQNRATDSPSGRIEWPHRITYLFQKLARISRESDQFLEVLKKEESKIETYKKISNSLKNITSSAENTFASHLARCLLTHKDCTSLIEKNNKSCQEIWMETMNIISEEAKHVVDAHLQDALLSIKDEAEKGVSVIGSGINKRRRTDGGDVISDFLPETPPISVLRGFSTFNGTEEASRDIKRQRLDSTGNATPDWIKFPEDTYPEQVDLIKQLKQQVDKQKQILLGLTEENNEDICLLRMELDNEATARIPSPASSDSENDSYNTESARIYFGPLKTPERNFVASSKSLFPPPSNSPLRRSPRLSSPRPPSGIPDELQAANEDLEDIEQVAQLINESEDEDDSVPNSGVGTPQNGEVVDEPSSALADRVMHALDNPSPPPSPPAALSLFDPYHTTVPEVFTDYQADLMSLKITDTVDDIEENPLLIYHNISNPTPTLIPMTPLFSTLGSVSSAANEVLINLDSISTPPMKKTTDIGHDDAPLMDSKILSVDDLLLQSPAFSGSGEYLTQLSIPAVVVQSSGDEIPDAGSPMAVDSLPSPANQEVIPIPAPLDLEEQNHQNPIPLSPNETKSDGAVAAEGFLTPLRRSTRPRRSVTPNPTPTPPALVSPPSIARTQVKRRSINVEPLDEIVSDSQDESDSRKSSSRATPTAVRVRQRSPTKVGPSFHREVGSLSPTSSNVLSGLAFSIPDEPTSGNAVNEPETQPSQPMFSFSVFTPPETAGPSTPVRYTGPIRFASPSKTSPQKFRIRTPAPNDPNTTPARRIPIAEAIVQGHISPQKAVQLGYKKPNGAPLPSLSTPARRVFLTDAPAPSTYKLNNSRLGSPTRMLNTKQREGSAEPPQRLGQSTKGKERVIETDKKPSVVASKLPFPLVASGVSTSETTSSSDPGQPSKSSPVKSTLKQPTSRIPRIGTKPYARSADNKSNAKPIPPSRLVDLAKPPPKPSIIEGARRSVRVPDVTKTVAPPPSRIKPSTATSTTLLKRKREAEKASPPKPRVIMLRQVPSIPVTSVDPPANAQAPPVPAPSSLQTTKQPSQGPLRIRKVMDPVTPAPRPVTPPQNEPSLPESNLPVVEPPTSGHNIAMPKEASPPHLIELDDNDALGSPMKQDPPQPVPGPAEQPDLASSIVVVSTPTVTVSDFSTNGEAPTSGLRRTTRSRRNANTISDVFTEGSSRSASTSRRKPSSFRSDDIFGGMSITALKDLTSSNTVHNQKYLAARLETEVVRKEGIRPESPAVKVRTILQRQQEEKDKQRSERAKRRSRRSDEMASSDFEASSDVGYSSPVEDQGSENEQGLPKHQRGAGDEEDYVTPERHLRGLKRTRLFEDSDMQDVDPPKRRVKWDRGLFTTVYIDEVQLGTRQNLKENRATKGILAPTAKALRLDTLGNLPYADVPLTDLVPENITVKKIVYDSDVTAAEIVAAKNTRSKKKK